MISSRHLRRDSLLFVYGTLRPFVDLPYADAKERASMSFDRAYVERLMARTGGNVSEAARQAGMDRSNFRRLLKRVRGGGAKGIDDVESGS